MSTIDTSTWSPDSDLNVDIGGIPLDANASIQQTWQAIQMLMAALKGDTAAIELTINQPDGTTIVATNQTLTVVDNGHAHTIANVTGLQTALNGKASNASMTGATASADGASGLVPKPEAGDQDKVLKGDGTWGAMASSQIPSLPSSKITSMTGYSKPSSTSAIATSDSLNSAIGKLEKDNDYLHDEFLLAKGVADNAYAVGTANTLLIQDLQDALDAMLKTKIYPVGSTFFSLTDSRNPSVILGFGTWTAIEGKFLLGASSSYAANSTGGEATHTLTESEMPEHYHDSLRYKTPTAQKFGCNSGNLSDTSWTVPWNSGKAQDYYVTGNTGGSQPHNNLPPYLAGYLWRRTA